MRMCRNVTHESINLKFQKSFFIDNQERKTRVQSKLVVFEKGKNKYKITVLIHVS